MNVILERFLKPFSIAGLAMSGSIFFANAQEAVKKPNILFIAVDDLKPELGCYGNKLIKTPNIDRLAARGMVFMQNYCQQAVSGPTRASLMTGMRPDFTKVWDLKTRMRDINPDTREAAQKYIEEANVKGLRGNEARQYAVKFVRPSVECMDLPDNAYNDGAMTDRAEKILSDLSKEKRPFFFAIGFARPHLPFVAPKKYWDLYNRDEMPLAQFQEHAKNSPELAYHNSGELREYSDIPSLTSFSDIKINHIGLPKEKQKELIHGYYAAVSYIDAQVGKILQTLDSLGLAENTIIVLWGDHGWHLGDHDLWCKHTNFEQAARAPLLISDPRIKQGKTISISEFVDIFPTLCELSGLKTPDGLDGISLVPIMKNPQTSVKEYAISQFPHEGKMGYSIRTNQFRLTWWMQTGFRSNKPFNSDLIIARELYDYKKDPLETVNVADNKKYEDISDKLGKMLVEYFKGQGNI